MMVGMRVTLYCSCAWHFTNSTGFQTQPMSDSFVQKPESEGRRRRSSTPEFSKHSLSFFGGKLRLKGFLFLD